MESGDKSDMKQEKDVNKKNDVIQEESGPAEKTRTKKSARNTANCGKAKTTKPTNENEESESANQASESNKSANSDEASDNVESANQSSEIAATGEAEEADDDEPAQNEDELSGAGPSGEVSVSQKLKHACMHCPKSFARKKELTTHLYIHRENQNNDCTICGKNFTTATLLRRHNNAHHKPRAKSVRQHVCHHCAYVYSTQRQLEKHHIECHVTQKQFECNVCGASFSWAQNLKKHKQAHEVNPHRCKICLKEFVDQTSLRVHVLANHKAPHRFGPTPIPTSQPGSFVCSICGRGFQFDFSYRAHMEAHVVPAQGSMPAPAMESAGASQSGSLPVNTPQYVTVDQEGIIDLDILSGGGSSISMGSSGNEIVIEVYRDEPDSQPVYPTDEPDSQPVFQAALPDSQLVYSVAEPPASQRIKVEGERVGQDVEDAEVEDSDDGGGESIEEFKKSLELPHLPAAPRRERQMFPRVNQDYKYIPVKNNVNKKKAHVQRESVPFLFDCVMTNEKPFGCEVCGMTFRWQISLDIHYREHVQSGNMRNAKVAKPENPEKKPAAKEIARKRGRPAGSGKKDNKYIRLQEQSGAEEELSQGSSEVVQSNVVHKQVASDEEETRNMDLEAAGNDSVQVVSSQVGSGSSEVAQNIQHQALPDTQPLSAEENILLTMVLNSDAMGVTSRDGVNAMKAEESVSAAGSGDKPARLPLFVNIKDSDAIVKWQCVTRWSRCCVRLCHMPLCGKIFTTSHSLAKHRSIIHLTAARRCADCPTAGVMYYSEVSLAVHRRLSHQRHKLYCLHCGKGFRIGADLCRHRRLHVGGKEVRKRLMSFEGVGTRRNKCCVCGKRYFLKSSLEEHAKEHPVCFDVSPVDTAVEGSVMSRDSGTIDSSSGGSEQDSVLRCSCCGKQFRTPEGYVFHQKQCSSNSNGNAVTTTQV